MRSQTVAPSTRIRALPYFLAGVALLALGHGAMYLFLAGDARAELAALRAAHPTSNLESAPEAPPSPQAGAPEYSTWLRSYELWHASKSFAVNVRQEGLVSIAMLLSLLVGSGLLANALLMRPSAQRPASRRRAMPLGTHRSAPPLRAVPRAQPVSERLKLRKSA
ncbi:MAG: hypothetical protein O2894_07530 [Planctomycetota bacterium]|nr:hypothetical protein [Planctomycetota bacterium]